MKKYEQILVLPTIFPKDDRANQKADYPWLSLSF